MSKTRVAKLWLDVPANEEPGKAFVLNAANLCVRLFRLASRPIALEYRPCDVIPLGDSMQAGALLAAQELRELLCQCPQGRQALRDLGFQPLLEDVESK